MKTIGMKIAASESVIDNTVKLISLAPNKAARVGGLPFVKMPHGIFQDHHRIVHQNPTAKRQGHERQIVEAVAEHEHDREGHEQGERKGNDRN